MREVSAEPSPAGGGQGGGTALQAPTPTLPQRGREMLSARGWTAFLAALILVCAVAPVLHGLLDVDGKMNALNIISARVSPAPSPGPTRTNSLSAIGLAVSSESDGPRENQKNQVENTLPDISEKDRLTAEPEDIPLDGGPLDDGANDYAIDETTPAYEFESGKSYFLAYRLPETRAAFSVEILSPLAAGGSYAFHPEVLLLDEKYVVVRRVDPRTFNFSGIQFAGPSHIGGTIAFPASGSPRSEKYMLVLTTESLMKLTTSATL